MNNCRGEVYHEKQVKQLCALHALNNLFQQPCTFSKEELDTICQDLSPDCWINPHRSALGLGNYDVNIIMAALQNKGFEAVWFDKRKDPMQLELNNVYGFIMNIPSNCRFKFVVLPFQRRHWIAIRQVNGCYYNLDSKLNLPQKIGTSTELVDFLREQIKCPEKELFIIVSNDSERRRLWLHDVNDNDNANKHSLNNEISDS
ncbi:josephin-1 [Nilaparvata lugens]|uniref:josephin-1 n=1 Tax=Nilaparvata lugens TaxID=108931 RepID=UPI00193EB380|nr:josephin-1 [Nilaparvata lugens]XP_022201568.2 josephin-1 [Nilaparvata lugens]XP_022201569.2 josephin-1 [Nilaparvata lugens]